MEGINIQTYSVGALKDIALLKAYGYIDTNTSPELQKLLSQVIEKGIVQFIIDMGAVQYVSSAGWGVFVGEIRSLREKGGDLKIAQMPPEVFEVFEMLEFNRILTCYDSVEEAIADFDFYRDVHAVSSNGHTETEHMPNYDNNSVTNSSFQQDFMKSKNDKPYNRSQTNFFTTGQHTIRTTNIADADLPLNEKIKKIVLENPILGPWGIKRTLYSPRFGYARVRYFKLKTILKRLSLNTKARRYRYFRSR